MNDWGWTLLGTVGVPLILFLWQSLLKREATESWGRRVGIYIALLLRQRLGVEGGDSLRDRFCSTIDDFINGLRQGLKMEVRR